MNIEQKNAQTKEKKRRMSHILNKHGKMRYERIYGLKSLLKFLMDRYDDDYIFQFINFNTYLSKEETDFLKDLYNSKK